MARSRRSSRASLGTSNGRWAHALRDGYAALTARRPGAPALVPAALGPDAGIIGAALGANGAG